MEVEVHMAKKKKRTRYRINWDAVKEALPGSPAGKKKKRKGRHLRKSVLLAIIALVAIILGILFVPKTLQNKNLKNLGYTSEQIDHIRSSNLVDTIINGNYYSEYLAKEFEQDNVKEEYLNLYAAMPANRELEDLDFLLYNRLFDEGYEADQLENLFSNLETTEITPLLVMDYQWDEQSYIDDVLANRGTENFVSGSYYTTYKLNYKTDTSDKITMLVNPSYSLESTWAPTDLTTLSTNYALDGVEMVTEAANAFASFCKASENAGAKFYALDAFRTYDTQASAYQNAVNTYGDSASTYACPAGYSEHETGLAVNVASTYEPSSSFKDTTAYQWAVENCYDYGFIPRYQEGKEYVTGMSAEPAHFRYVGLDVAKALKKSGLTYDEFYCLYLKEWDDNSNKPSIDILNATNWKNLLEN